MMLANIVHLEFLKQRRAGFSLFLILSATLVMTFLRQLVAQQSIVEGITGMLLLMAIAGIPAAALILSGPAGAALRSSSGKTTEEAFPFHPASRFLGAYLISLIQFASITLLLYSGAKLSGGLETWIDSFDRQMLFLAAMFQMHVLAFALSYIFRQASIGSMSAAAITGLQLSFFIYLSQRQSQLNGSPDIANLVAVTGPFLLSGMVMLSAKGIERDRRLGIVWITAFIGLLFFSPIFLFSNAAYKQRIFERRLEIAFIFSRLLNPESETILKKGVLLTTHSGNTVRMMSDGKKIKMGEAQAATFGPDHSVWLLAKGSAPNSYVVSKETNGRVQDVVSFSSTEIEPDAIVVHGTKLFVFGKDSEYQSHYAQLTSSTIPVWAGSEGKNIYDRSIKLLIEDGQAAFASGDAKRLMRKLPDGQIQTWELPGKAKSSLPFALHAYPAIDQPAGAAFLVPVVDDHARQRLILCRSDGTMTAPWPDASFEAAAEVRVYNLPGGGVAAKGVGGEPIYVMSADGRPYPPLKITNVFSYAQIKRLRGDQLWLMGDQKFVRFDLHTGRHAILSDWKGLPETDFGFNSAEEGLYFTRDEKVWLMDWDGRSHAIGSALLE